MTVVVKVLAFLVGFMFIKSCLGLFYWRMTHLSPEDLAWVKTISQKTSHDRFISESAPPLKLSITGMSVSNSGNPFYISSAGGSVYEASASYDYTLSGNGVELKGWLMVTRTVKPDSLAFYIKFHNLSTKSSNSYLPYQRMEVGGKVFDDCISSDSIHWKNNPHYKSDSIEIDKLIVSKRYGLIYFRQSNGTEYFRDF